MNAKRESFVSFFNLLVIKSWPMVSERHIFLSPINKLNFYWGLYFYLSMYLLFYLGVVREQDRPTLWPGNLLNSRVVPPSPITWGWWDNSLGLMCLRYGTATIYTPQRILCVDLKHSYTRGVGFSQPWQRVGWTPREKCSHPVCTYTKPLYMLVLLFPSVMVVL